MVKIRDEYIGGTMKIEALIEKLDVMNYHGYVEWDKSQLEWYVWRWTGIRI